MSLVRDVLGPDAIGAYLHGSAVLGGLRPRSDIDVLVVSRRGTTLAEKQVLVDRLLPISGSGDESGRSRSVELTIVVESDIHPWRYPPSWDFQYGDWLRSAFERGNLTPWSATNPDLGALITMVLNANKPLFGPPPAEVLDPVPRADLVRAIVAGIPDLIDDLDSDTCNVILTLSRIWTTAATGAIRSKDAAADWALARLPDEHRAVLGRARAVYVGDEEESWDDLQSRVRPHADHVIHEIERLTASASSEPAV